MILSMTGYGKSVVVYKDKKINVEIKSLNSKTLDLSARVASLPREGDGDKAVCREEALSWQGRLRPLDGERHGGRCHAHQRCLIEDYYKQLKAIAAKTGIPEPANWFSTLTRMPDVLTKTNVEELCDEEWEVAKGAIKQAVDNLVAFRKQEGAALEKKFHEKVDNIENLLHSIEPYEKSRVPKIKETIIKGLEQIPEVQYDKNRLEQELIYYIEKLDISEEKQRLANHLKYFRETMAEEQPNGKKLGFIAQEMGREINTTGSKSNQAEMQNIVVKMKDELEQIKEQVLNAL